MQVFQKLYISKFKAYNHIIILGIFQGPVTLPFLKVEAQNLVSWGILTCSVFHKYYFICRYFIAETVFDNNDIRMTPLERTHLFLDARTDHRVTKSENCIQFLIYFLFIKIMRLKAQNVTNLTIYDVSVTL